MNCFTSCLKITLFCQISLDSNLNSCINQLLSITHETCNSFDERLEVRSVFLGISKAFFSKARLFKLSQNGTSGNLLGLLSSFLSDRKQKVILNGQTPEWRNVTASVPQGSILGPVLFLIYINDLSGDLSSKADDASIFSVTHDITTSVTELNYDLKEISDWAF